jgi:hypothetical protein
MRGIAFAIAAVCSLTACLDVREFEGRWTGPTVGDRPELLVGFDAGATATLDIDHVDLHSLRARLTIEGDVFDEAEIQPVAGAEADVLSTMTFDGGPSRVYLAFVETADGGGPATVFVAVYYGERVEVRVLRGGTSPLYGIFALDDA